MKNKKVKTKLIRIQFMLFSLIFFIFCSGFDEGCGGSPPPSPPTFQISFVNSNNKTKFYFKPDEKVVIEKIEVKKNNMQVVETISFSYPFLICNANQTHIINDYSNAQNFEWEFIFSGVSNSTGYGFSSHGKVYVF